MGEAGNFVLFFELVGLNKRRIVVWLERKQKKIKSQNAYVFLDFRFPHFHAKIQTYQRGEKL